MGKATIVSGGDDGRYTVKIDYGTGVRDAHLQRITARLVKLETEMSEAQTKLGAQKVIEASKRAAVESAIAAFAAASSAVPRVKAGVDKALKAYSDAAKALTKEKGNTAKLRLALEMLQSQKAQLKKDEVYWTSLVLEETRQVWCADLSEDGKGSVATIEIPGESKHILIAPEARPVVQSDGALVAREVQTAAQVFFNAAILPGWQKWKPTFRAGTITAIDYVKDTADVLLSEDDVSSAQKLDINQTPALEKVPFEYMTCNSAAFEVGDVCVVQFAGQKWDAPKVVGFFDNPRPCGSGIGIAYAGEEGTQYVILTPSGKYRAPTGNWRARSAKSLQGGSRPWSSKQVGQYAVSGIASSGGMKYNGIAVTNKRDNDTPILTFGGQDGDAHYVAQAMQGGGSFRLSVARTPKSLRSLRGYKLQDKKKAFEIDVPWQEFADYRAVDVTADGRKVLATKSKRMDIGSILVASFNTRIPSEVCFITVGVPVSVAGRVLPDPEMVVHAEYPAGRGPEGSYYGEEPPSENPLTCFHSGTAATTYYTTPKPNENLPPEEWDYYEFSTALINSERRRSCDFEFPRPIVHDDPSMGLYVKPDGSMGQDMMRVVQLRNTVCGRNSSYSESGYSSSIAIFKENESNHISESASYVIDGINFEKSNYKITDSGDLDSLGIADEPDFNTGSENDTDTENFSLEANLLNREILFFDRQFPVLVYIENRSICNYSYRRIRTRLKTFEPSNIAYTDNKTPMAKDENHDNHLVVWRAGSEVYRKKVNGGILPNQRLDPDTGEYFTYIAGNKGNSGIGLGGDSGSISFRTSYSVELWKLFSIGRDLTKEGPTVEVKSAKDPLTGALVLHLNLQNDGFGGTDSKWFVFDGGSVKTISSISDIPEGTVPSELLSV